MDSSITFNRAKDRLSDGTNPVSYPSNRLHSGIGYVVLSREVDREQYISNCYRNNILTIRTNSGEIIKDCFVSKDVWNSIEFPQSNKDVGSCVVWLNIPIQNKCVIIASLNRKEEVLPQNDVNLSSTGRRSDGTIAEVQYNGNTGAININSDIGDSEGGEGNGVFIKVNNLNQLGSFKAYIQGEIDFESESQITYKAAGSIELFVGNEEQNDKVTVFRIINDNKVELLDEFGNLWQTDEDGMRFIDRNLNRFDMSDDGNEIGDNFDNEILTDKDGVHVSVKDLTKTIDLIAESNKDDKDGAVLFTPVKDLLNNILDKMTEICNQISSAQTINPVGGSPLTLYPTSIVTFQQLSSSIAEMKATVEQIKSKTVKLT